MALSNAGETAIRIMERRHRKTLLAFNTLERATTSGLRAMACDFDTQRMLVRQCALRNSRYPDGVELDIVDGDLTVDGIQELEAIHHDDYDLVICDMPGTNTFTMDRALDVMDAIIVPISGGPYELISTSNLIAKATTKGWPTYLIPNNIPPSENRRARARSSVQQIGTNMAPIQLVRHVAHPDAAELGQTAPEYAPSSQAAAEISEYWAWLQGAVDITRSSNDTAHLIAEVLAQVG